MTRVETIGDATLHLRDCREVLPTLSGDYAVVTDPPYEIEGTWSGGAVHGWGRFKGEAAKWDRRPEWFADWIAQRGCSPSIIWGGQYFTLPPTGSWLVWDKVVRRFTGGHCELAWTNLGMPVRAFNFTNGELATEGKLHPTQKPLALMQWCLSFLPAGDRAILDPFMGAGTTGVAAIKRGCKFVGIEIAPAYFDIACRRVEEAWKQPRLFADRVETPPQGALGL